MDKYKPRSVTEFQRYSNFVGIKVRRHGGGSKLTLPDFIVNFDLPGESESWERLVEWFALDETELTQVGTIVERYNLLTQIELNDVVALAFTETIPEVAFSLLARFSLAHPPTKKTLGK